jgi:hypothetical protein
MQAITPRPGLLSYSSTLRGHKTDTSETTRATPRDASLGPQSARFCRKNCVASDRECTHVTPRNIVRSRWTVEFIKEGRTLNRHPRLPRRRNRSLGLMHRTRTGLLNGGSHRSRRSVISPALIDRSDCPWGFEPVRRMASHELLDLGDRQQIPIELRGAVSGQSFFLPFSPRPSRAITPSSDSRSMRGQRGRRRWRQPDRAKRPLVNNRESGSPGIRDACEISHYRGSAISDGYKVGYKIAASLPSTKTKGPRLRAFLSSGGRI